MSIPEILNLIASIAIVGVCAIFSWKLTRPVKLCGNRCQHPDSPSVSTGNDRYVRCFTCPMANICDDDSVVKPCGRIKGQPFPDSIPLTDEQLREFNETFGPPQS